MCIVESLSLPDTFEEWDVGGGSLADYRERYTAAIKEIKAAIGIHLLSNLLLLVPIIFTGKLAKKIPFTIFYVSAFNVRTRHFLLVEYLEATPEETDAFSLVNHLAIMLPVTVLLSSILDIFLVFAFYKWLHPFKMILEETEEKAPEVSGVCKNHVYDETQGPAERVSKEVWLGCCSCSLSWVAGGEEGEVGREERAGGNQVLNPTIPWVTDAPGRSQHGGGD